MPIFEYECQKCGLEFEKLVRRADETLKVTCPACNSRKVDEKISAFSSRVKGGSSSRQGSCAPSGG